MIVKILLCLTSPSHIFGVGGGQGDGWMAKLGFHATGFEDSFGFAFVESRRQICGPLSLRDDVDQLLHPLTMQKLDWVAIRHSYHSSTIRRGDWGNCSGIFAGRSRSSSCRGLTSRNDGPICHSNHHHHQSHREKRASRHRLLRSVKGDFIEESLKDNGYLCTIPRANNCFTRKTRPDTRQSSCGRLCRSSNAETTQN